MRVFIHHDGALGDVLLSLPLLHAIRKDSGVLHFAGRADIGILLRECGIAGETSSSGSSRYASLYGGRADNSLADFLRSFERAFLFTVDPALQMTEALISTIPSTKVILTIPTDDVSLHVSDFRRSQFADTGLPEKAQLPIPQHYRDMAATLLGRAGYDGYAPVVAVHGGSGSRSKCWPMDRFFELADRLKANGAFILMITGPAEDDAFKDRVEAFARSRGGVMHLSDGELISVAALLATSSLFIGNDSGAGHLAASINCPVLSLFGPTDPLRWAPRGSRVEVIRSRSLADITVDQVYSTADVMLSVGK